ncbi:hypothetical protein RHOFW104R3_27865 [Rhodanobacter denitrificans]|nr:hypothetical protein RHOFW104R3_27865 [Rhodanobacter denitrificans]
MGQHLPCVADAVTGDAYALQVVIGQGLSLGERAGSDMHHADFKLQGVQCRFPLRLFGVFAQGITLGGRHVRGDPWREQIRHAQANSSQHVMYQAAREAMQQHAAVIALRDAQ